MSTSMPAPGGAWVYRRTASPKQKLADAKVLHGRGEYDACVTACFDILTEHPDYVAAVHLLGVCLFRLGDHLASSVQLARAVALAPHVPALRLDHASALIMLGRATDAIEELRAGLLAKPADAELSKHLAKLLSGSGRHIEAQAVLAAALRRSPRRSDLLCDLAIEYAADLRLREALILLRLAEQLQPADGTVQLNIGTVQQALGALDRAAHHHARAVAQDPQNAQAHVNLAMARLGAFDVARGFAEFEWRLRLPIAERTDLAVPRWHGQALGGRRLLVTVEQGLGDMIQYARFLHPLRARGAAEIVLECRPELHRLFGALPGIATCVAGWREPLPDADFHVPLMSLPFELGCDAASLSQDVPYLKAAAGTVAGAVRGSGLRIGLVWAASPGKGSLFVRRSLDRRSCALSMLRDLVTIPGTRFFSLQKGEPAGELAGETLPIVDLGRGFKDFADTAAAIMALDLVIAVDTSVAHLAGALGKPVWILLAPGQADYRWGTGADRTPWYPTARLFRAGHDGWAGAIEAACTALRMAVASRSEG